MRDAPTLSVPFAQSLHLIKKIVKYFKLGSRERRCGVVKSHRSSGLHKMFYLLGIIKEQVLSWVTLLSPQDSRKGSASFTPVAASCGAVGGKGCL